jgi:sodium-dependent dicarboxylate transporter 2/3/5
MPLTLPDGLSPAALRLLAVVWVMGVWWVTEALPMGATALVPAATFPLLGVAEASPTCQAYMKPIIMLLLGGFLLALAVERSGAHRRLALHVLLALGTSPRRLVLGFAVAAAALSMWISNTATALIMMPIAAAIADRAGSRAFAVGALLAVAYGASVGGMATPVGTPPNLIAISALEDAGLPSVSFIGWAATALPAVVVIVPLVGLILTRVAPGVPAQLEFGAAALLRSELASLGRWRPSELRSVGVFALTALLWVTRPDLRLGEGWIFPGWATRLGLVGTHDGTVAMLGALLAFSLPAGEGTDEATGLSERLLPWQTALRAPWGLVLLFGGGVALSLGFASTGLSAFVGQRLAESAGASWAGFIAVVCLTCTFGTEIISNTALANIAMPILAATAEAAGREPRALLLPAAMACSCAFMMPMATGPNAIVFGSGRLRILDMARAGLWANLTAWAVIVVAALLSYPT